MRLLLRKWKIRRYVEKFPFHWNTDFDFSAFGGWKNNQEGHTHERNLLVIIPGKNRNEAIIMADHYDTAYMEDIYDKSSGGVGARIAAAGADDNCSATATLLQAAPVFLKLSKEGLLERDIWLVHLTGEEFPSDCMGSRHFAQALVEKTLQMRLNNGQMVDLSGVRVVGVYVMDMIGHNRDSEMDIFQISPGKGQMSLQLAWQAHLANDLWNVETKKWNQSQERRGKGRGKRSLTAIKSRNLQSFCIFRVKYVSLRIRGVRSSILMGRSSPIAAFRLSFSWKTMTLSAVATTIRKIPCRISIWTTVRHWRL